MKTTLKVQLPGKCSSQKRGPSETTECKALLTCSGSSLLPSVLRYHTGKGWIPGSAGGNVAQLSFSAPLSTQQSRVRFHPWVSERMWAWHLGDFSARSLQGECCFSRNSRNSASTSAHSTSQFDLRDIKVWSWTSHWRHWGPSEILSGDHRSLRLSWRHNFTGHYHSQFLLRVGWLSSEAAYSTNAGVYKQTRQSNLITKPGVKVIGGKKPIEARGYFFFFFLIWKMEVPFHIIITYVT